MRFFIPPVTIIMQDNPLNWISLHGYDYFCKRITANMKKLILCLLASLLLLSEGRLAAQDYEVAASWGGIPAFYDGLLWGFQREVGPYGSPRMDAVFADYKGPLYTAGLYNLEFNIIRKKWLVSSFSLGTTSFWRPTFSVLDGRRKGAKVHSVLSLMHTWRFTYVNRPVFRMYSSIGLGIVMTYDPRPDEILPIFQLAPLGISVGKRIYGFGEIGLGAEYIGGRAGIGYRFNSFQR